MPWICRVEKEDGGERQDIPEQDEKQHDGDSNERKASSELHIAKREQVQDTIFHDQGEHRKCGDRFRMVSKGEEQIREPDRLLLRDPVVNIVHSGKQQCVDHVCDKQRSKVKYTTNPATDRRDSQEAYRAKKEIAAGQQEGHQREYCVVSEQQLACCPFQFTYF